MKKITLIVLISILFTAALAAIDIPENVDLSNQPAGVKTIEASNRGFTFYPSTITVKKGDTIRLTYTNGGGYHDWVIDEFGAATNQISGGKSETIEFTVDQTGTFEFYCSVGNHRKQGMFGKLIVVD